MKKIFITESQEKFLKESISNNVIDDLIINDSHVSFDISLSIEKKLIQKQLKHYKEKVAKLFGNDIVLDVKKASKRLGELLFTCMKYEEPNRKMLEKMVCDSVYEAINFDIDNIEFSCELVNEINDGNIKLHITPQEDDNYEYEDSNEVENIEDEINKRLQLLTFIVGMSNALTKIILKKKKLELEKISPELYNLYRQILLLNEFILLSEVVDINEHEHNQIGGVDVYINDKTEIKSKALLFPILIFESLKGFFELYISDNLPKELSLTNFIIDKTDSIIYGQNQLIIGNILISNLINNVDVDTLKLPNLLKKISGFNPEAIRNILKELLLNTKTGKNLFKKLISNIDDEIAYNDFETNLQNIRKEKNIMLDDYFSSEELLKEND